MDGPTILAIVSGIGNIIQGAYNWYLHTTKTKSNQDAKEKKQELEIKKQELENKRQESDLKERELNRIFDAWKDIAMYSKHEKNSLEAYIQAILMENVELRIEKSKLLSLIEELRKKGTHGA